ncbi:hypothetical protein KAR28_00910 [Candidatus Parcubacteria bacterium]|nr:hypothetical protein [Candidatus Parcubacteria bacterium]
MSTKKLKEYMKNPPLVKIGGATLINFSKIIEETMKDPKRGKNIEMEMKKLENKTRPLKHCKKNRA